MSDPKPLVSFVLLSYKQEQFIREAVAGAFAQTYTPLEIIISDDASPDQTFEIIREMAAEYRGPHKVVINRNPVNLGLALHVNMAFEKAQGEIIVTAAGDDISFPNRVALTCEAFAKNPTWTMLAAHVELFGQLRGTSLRYALCRKQRLIEACWNEQVGYGGCSAAYKKSLFLNFPKLNQDCLAEDMAYSFRSALLGVNGTVDAVLVKYRVSDNSVSLNRNIADFHLRQLKLKVSGIRQNIQDLEHFLEINNKTATFAKYLLKLRWWLLASQIKYFHAQPIEWLFSVAYRIICFGGIKFFKIVHFNNTMINRRRLFSKLEESKNIGLVSR